MSVLPNESAGNVWTSKRARFEFELRQNDYFLTVLNAVEFDHIPTESGIFEDVQYLRSYLYSYDGVLTDRMLEDLILEMFEFREKNCDTSTPHEVIESHPLKDRAIYQQLTVSSSYTDVNPEIETRINRCTASDKVTGTQSPPLEFVTEKLELISFGKNTCEESISVED